MTERPPAKAPSSPTRDTDDPTLKTTARTTVLAGLLAYIFAPGSVAAAAAPTAAAGSSPSPQDQTLTLTPFEVSADSDTSYGALNSNSITRFKTALIEMPVTADVFTEAFMKDVGATSVEELVSNYTAGGGYTTNDPGSDAAAVQAGDRQATSSVTVRGLMSPTLRRDAFIQLGSLTNPGSTGQGFTSNFDIERVEVINGPQSLLYGSGGAGGVLNTISKQARFNRPHFGSFKFTVDQYGGKTALVDYGLSGRNIAARVAVMNGLVAGRRVNIGGPVEGYYLQLATKLREHTIVRLTASQTEYDRLYNANLTVNAGNATNDGRHGQNLKYLVATNQIQRSEVGTSNAGPLLGGFLDWGNADSFAGWHRTERSKNEYITLTAESKWNRWLSTDFSVGYNNFEDRLKSSGGGAFLTPNNPTNPIRDWASSVTGATIWKPTRTTALRFAAVASHKLFGHDSQTMFGADYNRSKQWFINYNLYRADANGNLIGNQITGLGRQTMPTLFYSIAGGPVGKPFFDPFNESVTIDGVTYVRRPTNERDPALISANNPLGVRSNGGTYTITELRQKGIYLVNHSKFMRDRLAILLGARYNDSDLDRVWTNSPLSSESKNVNFNIGANYAIRDWLRPYVAASSSFNPPLEAGIGPDGVQVETSHALGGEVGVKLQNRRGSLSATATYFYLNSDDEQQRIPGALVSAINPTGLNGAHGAASTWANVDRKSSGLQAAVTYNPSRNLRMRVSAAYTDGTVGTTKTYAQLYNDQFHANAAGQVTYADRTPVYVPSTPNVTTPVVSATTAGATPLTIAMMSTPGNPYYAQPEDVTGRIAPTSAAARVLNITDPVRGSILTGETGLPISALQINPGFTPPGEVATIVAGEKTTGYGEYSFNYTSMYTFSEGWIKGLRIGGNLALDWRNRGFYYYPTGTAGANPKREAYYWPNTKRVGLILGYDFRIKRYGFSSQLNVYNVFNRYDVIVTPNAITGWAGVKNATFFQEPRRYVWSNTITF